MPIIDPAIAAVPQGGEWQIPGLGTAGPAPAAAPAGTEAATGAEGAAQGQGFGDMLANQVKALQESQAQGAESSRSLVEGTATDVSKVVMDVERAKLSMQLASQIRGKATEAFQEVFRTQV